MGLRRMRVTVHLVHEMLRRGTGPWRPLTLAEDPQHGVPDDLEVLHVRLNIPEDCLDLIVSSASFEGPDLGDDPLCVDCAHAAFRRLPLWDPAFRRLDERPGWEFGGGYAICTRCTGPSAPGSTYLREAGESPEEFQLRLEQHDHAYHGAADARLQGATDCPVSSSPPS